MAKFWTDGLNFSCHQCGKCCTFQGGSVYGSEEEFQKIADFLSITLAEFYTLYTVNDEGFVSIKSYSSGPCVFYKQGCSIYPVRPAQCRTYPFWPEILKNKTRWENEAKSCSGINKGTFWAGKDIKDELSKNNSDILRTGDLEN